MTEEENVEVQQPIQRESTQEDYWNTLNPAAIPYNNPELKFTTATDSYGTMDTEEPEFKAIYDKADGATKIEMLKANNNSDAIKLAQRREIFVESQKATAQDGVMTQLGMGLLPAVFSPSSALPFGYAFKAASLAKTASRFTKALQVGAVGAVAGGTANAVDEAMFDAQGMPTNYVGAIGIGVFFGGGLGLLGGAISGPSGKNIANGIDPKQDTYTRDYDTDHSIIMEEIDGVLKLQEVDQMSKSIVDKIPWLGDKLRSDVHKVLQSENPIIRSLMLRMSNATVSVRDAAGNVLPVNKTGHEIKREAKGVHNNLVIEMTDVYGGAVKSGYKGDLDTFNKDVWQVYVKAMNEQKSAAAKYTNEMNVDITMKNKADRKAELAKVDEDLLYYRNDEGKVVPMTEDLVGKMPEDKIVIKKDTKGNRAKLKEEINTRYAEELDVARKKSADEFFNENEFSFKGDENLVKGAESYRKYYREMLKKSKEVGIKELQGMNVNRLYSPRTYNYKGIKSGDVKPAVVEAEVRAGLINDARNNGLSKEALDEAVKSIVEMLNKTAFDLNNLTTSFLTKTLPFNTHLKQKKLYLNEAYMPNILKNDMGELVGAYHYQMSGRQGVQHAFGTDDLTEIMDMVREGYADKLDTKGEVVAFERTVKDLLGTLRMNQLADTPSWTFTRNLTSFNSSRLGGGFGGNQFIELISSVVMNGMKALMSGRLTKSLKNTSSLLFTKDGKQDKFAQYLIGSGFMEDALHTSRINRYADTESGFNSGWLENKLNWMNDKLMKYNGMRYFMGVMEDYTGAAVVTKLKSGDVDVKTLGRWGLSEADAKELKPKLEAITKGDKWDIESLDIKDRDAVQLAITRGIEEMVVQGDSIHLPNWMKAPSQFTKLITQFMRFPLIAQETLTRRGMAENQAQMVAGIMSSIATYMGMKYLREQAAISMGTLHEADAKYLYDDYNDDEYMRVIGEALNYTAPLGMLGGLYNYGAIATGNNELGRDWNTDEGIGAFAGPTGGLASDVITIMRQLSQGEGLGERELSKAKSLLPGANLPLIHEGGQYLIQEFGR